MTAPGVSIHGISKAFGNVRALDGVSLSIGKGLCFALLGPSGCGKTTLMRIIAGFERPDEGAVSVDGVALGTKPPQDRPVNLMFQSYALFPHLSVRENIAFGLRQRGDGSGKVRARTDAMLALVKLEALADRKPAALSGGQRQRVALARALAREPSVLLLDEPLGALDRRLRQDMQIELKRIQRETGATFIVVTHDQEEAMVLSDQMAVMRQGRIVQVGAPAEVYAHPADRFVAGFIGDANLLPVLENAGHGGSRAVRVASATAPIVLSGAPAQPTEGGPDHGMLLIRPENLGLTRQAADVPDTGCIPATVQDRTVLGPTVRYRVASADGVALLADLPVAHDPGFARGDAVFATFPAASARWLP